MVASNTAQGQPSGSNATRAVEVVNLPSNPVPVTGAVSVSGPAGAPLPVREVGESRRRPFHFSTSCTPVGGGTSCLAAYGVPNDKRAVIEFVSANSFFGDAGAGLRIAVTTEISGNRVTHSLPLAEKVGGKAAVGAQVNLYSDAGTTVVFFAERLGSFGAETIHMSISGHLVDAD
ncbi:MAG: hypothetical protein ACK4S4_14845 [Pyrinomonadaceae bacterium]